MKRVDIQNPVLLSGSNKATHPADASVVRNGESATPTQTTPATVFNKIFIGEIWSPEAEVSAESFGGVVVSWCFGAVAPVDEPPLS